MGWKPDSRIFYEWLPTRWYKERLFANHPRRKFMMLIQNGQGEIIGSRVIGAVTLCCIITINEMNVITRKSITDRIQELAWPEPIYKRLMNFQVNKNSARDNL